VKSLMIIMSTVALTACAALPKEDRNVRSHLSDINAYATAQSFAAPAGAWPMESWWKGYRDAQLDQLIDEALASSPTLAVADARLRRARAFSDATAAADRLQVNANASATEQKQSENFMTPPGFTPGGWNDYGRATLDFSLDLDLWGKNRKALSAAISEAEATQADAAQARLTLATAIASAYAELAREYALLDTAAAARDVRIKTAELFRGRFDNGLETVGSVRQVESRRAGAEAEVLGIEEQLSLQKNRIAALVGAGPDRGFALTRPTIDLARDFALPENLAANLLGRRPDLVAARLRAEAAASRVGQARAAFYPNVNLTAFIGVQSMSLDRLTKDGSSIGSVGPALSLPVFSGGRLRAQLRSVDAEYLEAVASYDRTLIAALQEVADVSASERALGPQLARVNEAVEAAREAWRVQSNRYEGGLATYLEVLSAEDYLLSVLRTQTDMQSRSLSLGIALTRVLGGGYSL
jgi:NodT family efflux transporter outer membrane factor (OMF) lipoprotein